MIRDTILLTLWAAAVFCAAMGVVAFFSGCYGSHEDITPALFDAGTECPEGWVHGNAAQPGECLRIAPGSPADGRVP